MLIKWTLQYLGFLQHRFLKFRIFPFLERILKIEYIFIEKDF